MRSFVAVLAVLAGCAAAASATRIAHAQSSVPPLVPQPRSVTPVACTAPLALARPLRFASDADAGGFELLRERWTALGIPAPMVASTRDRGRADVTVRRLAAAMPPSAYAVVARNGSVVVSLGASSEAGRDALVTLAQLPQRVAGRWVIPCVSIADEPSMSLRVLSDDVSRGPFPTMDYARARIRELAFLKYNGWSPYMEQVVFDPRHPYVAWPNAWTTTQLRALALYARRFHVELIPEQQTFAHMHEALKWEALAPLADLPHGYLVAASDAQTYAYVDPLVRAEARAVMPRFFHLGADEPIDLGRGRTPRTAQVFADHVRRVADALAGTGARPIIWDDAIQQDHAILGLLPRDVVVATFHYGVEPTYRPYIDAVASAGFDQLVAPGAANWNEIYPDLAGSYANVARFVGEARGARHMLGMFMTVWHDDGETLYDATWPAVAYAAATAWQSRPVDDATWHRTFVRAFFGTDDPAYARDLDALEAMRTMLRTSPSDPPDYLFWHDPFDPALQARAQALDLAGIRTRAESVLQHLLTATPPLHADAAKVMVLAALRYDALARRLQIGKEARDDYDDARAHATTPNDARVYRSLNLAKYLCWEMRDALADVEPLYAAAWRAESTEPGLARVLPRYRVAEDDAQRCADRIDVVEREDYLRKNVVPAWDEVMSRAR